MHILTLVAAVASDGESWEVLAEGCAADYTGNFRDIARRLISTCQRQPRNEEEAFRDDEVRKSYSADKHTFDYILHTGTMLMFLSLSDENSTTRESFRYLEVIKNVVLSAVRDYTTDYFHLGSGALPASSNGNGWQQHSPHADGERLAYAAVVRGAFRSAVMQYLRETATNMSFPEDDVELGGKGGGATLRVDFHRSSSTASSSGTEQENSPSVLEEPFMDMTLSSTRRINSDSSIRPQATSLVGTPSTTAMTTTAVGLLPPPPDDLRSRKLCNSYDSGLQLRRRGSGLVVGDGIPPPPGPADWAGGPGRRASVRIRGLRVRRSRDEMSAFDDNDEEDSSSAGSSPAVLPDTVQMKVRRDVDEEDRKAHAAILLPMDYSGMAEEGSYGESLLKAMDVQVKNALQTQVSIAESVDALLTVLHMFRDTLKDIPLPPPTSVDLKQALKDAQRETIVVNGKTFKGDAEGLEREMRRHVEPFASSETAQLLCQDIMRASSRTASGGDSYSIATSLLCRRGNLLTPAQVESSPITITISPEGVVNILAENVYALHRNMMMDVDEAEMNGGGKSSGHQRKASKSKIMDFLGGGKKQQEPQGVANGTVGSADNPEAAEGGADLILTTVLEVRLSILERSSSRRLRIRSGEVEKCPPQYLALGSGEPDVNGAYTVKGFKNRAPWYENPDGVQLVKDVVTSATGLMGSPGLLARMESSPSKASASQQPCWTIATPSGSGSTHRVYYVQRGSVSLLPPCEGWEAMHEDVRQPPPTLMPNFSAVNRRPSSQVVRRGTHSFGEDASPRDSMRRDSLAKAAGAITAALSSAGHQQQPQQQQQQQGGSSSNTSSGRGFRAIPRFF